MPDTWTILKENSSLDSGDAWEHLNNQEGGTGPGGSLVLLDGLEIQMGLQEYILEIDQAFIIEIPENYCIEVQKLEYVVEIDY